MATLTPAKHRDVFGRSGGHRALLTNYNLLAQTVENIRRQLTYMMPGVLTTAPASKAGTSAATAWRTEIFSFTFRGLVVTTSAQEKAFTDNTHDVAASKEAWFVLTVQTNGTSFTITKAADQTIATQLRPTGPDNEVIVGYLQIITGATGWAATADDLVADGPKIASFAFEDAPALGTAANTATTIGNLAGTVITA